ncbi:MAG: hypothetical protein FJZ58_02320 [Chlamydiae bacterium]|nr:hypothetical protein [Chlamydiota bacterium]
MDSLASRYQLHQEISFFPNGVEEQGDKKTYPLMQCLERFIPAPGQIGIPIEVLNISILYNTSLVPILVDLFAKIYQPKQPCAFEQRTNNKNLSPLHIAVIVGNLSAVKALIQAKVQIDALDLYHWTPLHHAALSGRKEIVEELTNSGADERIRTNKGATYSMIWQWTQPPSTSMDARIPLLWRSQEGNFSPMIQEEFMLKTKAFYIEHFKMSKEQVFATWSPFVRGNMVFPFTEGIRKTYEKHLLGEVSFPQVYLSQVTSTRYPVGLGVFAKNPMARGQILGEYLGEVLNDPYKEKKGGGEYLCDNYDAAIYRNEIAQMNDGFPNAVFIPVNNIGGMDAKNVFVALEDIAEGEQIVWNYGFMHRVKNRAYVEMRKEKLRSFLDTCSLIAMIQCAGKVQACTCSWDEFIISEKFRYILSSPSVQFSLTLEGKFALQELIVLQNLYRKEYAGHGGNPSPALQLLVPIAAQFLQLQKLCKDLGELEFLQKQKHYIDDLLERKGICYTLAILEDSFQAVEEYIKKRRSGQTSIQEGKLWIIFEAIAKEVEQRIVEMEPR